MHIARKRFGQHFLHDKLVIQKIIDAIHPQAEDHLVEIGPGQGALTVPILRRVGQLDVIELDRDLIPSLKVRCLGKGALIVHQGDAMVFDFSTLVHTAEPLRIFGNLPYNISTPLLFHLLSYSRYIKDMHFMLQKEVVDRIAAKPHTPDYGRLSIMVQYQCQTTDLFNVEPGAFYPPPQVESSVIRIIPYHQPPFQAKDYQHFAELVKLAFSHRRKTLRNSLKNLVSDEQWRKINIDSQLRPEELSVEQYVLLSNVLLLSS